MNASQLAAALRTDPKTTRKHLVLLSDNKLVMSLGDKYAVTYFVSPDLEAHWDVFLEIARTIVQDHENQWR